MKRILTYIAAAMLLMPATAVTASAARKEARKAPVKVACVGNSITYGLLVEDREHNSYPARLQNILGEGYEVGNFGHSGTTLLERGHRPYIAQTEYEQALAMNPDIVVIHLGINDTDPRDWPNYSEDFEGDYLRLIESFRKVNPDVRVIVANLTPIGAQHPRFKSGTRVWRDKVRESISRVAQLAGVEYIDFEDTLIDSPQLLSDGIHPNAAGAAMLADDVAEAITGDFGGLSMPVTYTDHMVLQRRRPVHISGRADRGTPVTVTFAGQKARATAGYDGRWTATLLPMEASTGNTLTVSTPDKTLTYGDVAVGEVWLASGQSNMEFRMRNTVDAKTVLPTTDDPGLRLFAMHPMYITNNREWDSAAVAAVDRLEYYAPAAWAPSSPESAADFSAVAWHFGKTLRDSLGADVPVGIIANPVGGAPLASFVDMSTLMHGIPEMLVNWRGNDYLQPWVQQRAGENVPDKHSRHPYEPGYLYAAGVRPIADTDFAGVIWYQGESDAHNVELFEETFPMLLDSWRTTFGDPQLPFYTVQLSSIDRPTWPSFRDSQRRLAERLEGVNMAVSSDLGDSLDVHPRNKRPVGERLGRLALRNSYGFTDMVDRGPVPVSAVADDNGIVTITFDNAPQGLATADGREPITFEVAEAEGMYRPATATIEGNTVRLTGHGLTRPRLVRYGWQPFTRANLINTYNLPTSTFKMQIDNSASFRATVNEVAGYPSSEKGYAYGTSAPYAGMLDGNLLMAGGCNFPAPDPTAADAVKRYYRGVFTAAATPASTQLKWTEAARLEAASAYGVAVPVAAGLLTVGGLDADNRPMSAVSLLTLDAKGRVAAERLADAPFTLDNAYGCAWGTKVYVCGGNLDGAPSNALWCFDLADRSWTRLADMPGNPRVQPVMAASGGSLYVWGGFAGKSATRPATLNTDGLRYDIATGEWSALEAPRGLDGEEISLGGGVAVTLPCGSILAMGGVNKDVFIDALRDQKPDYLFHPVEWYRFNDRILLYTPADGKWQEIGRDSRCARAGAAIAADGHGAWLMGGEIKPRVRTPHIVYINVDPIR